MQPLENLTANESNCEPNTEDYIQAKYVLIAVFGTAIATIGALNNLFLVYIFHTRAEFRNTHMLFLACLAALDVLISGTYILIFVLEILYDYYNNYTLYLMWHSYVRPLFVCSRITGTASTYLIIAASFERFMAVSNYRWTKKNCTNRDRFIVILAVILFAIISRISIFFELTVVRKDSCAGTFGFVTLTLAEWASDPYYDKIYRLYFNNVIHILLPFIILVILNILVTIKLREALSTRVMMLQVGLGLAKAEEGRQKIKQATLSLIAIVTSYLILNVLGFIITLMEHISFAFLRRHMKFYTFASDCVNMLHVLNALVRIFIYYLCNSQVRDSINETFREILHLKQACTNSVGAECHTETYAMVAVPEDENANLRPSDSFDPTKPILACRYERESTEESREHLDALLPEPSVNVDLATSPLKPVVGFLHSKNASAWQEPQSNHDPWLPIDHQVSSPDSEIDADFTWIVAACPIETTIGVASECQTYSEVEDHSFSSTRV